MPKENNTLKQFKDNIRKYEMIEFMIAGETTQSHTEIKNKILTELIRTLAHNRINKSTNQLIQ